MLDFTILKPEVAVFTVGHAPHIIAVPPHGVFAERLDHPRP
jgi:hypothetical protein